MTSFDIDPESAPIALRVPGDWRRPSSKESYAIHWDETRAFGQIWPRPAQDVVIEFYNIEDYYTHEAEAASDQPLSFAQKALTKISWLADKSTDPDARWWAATLGEQPLRILEIGCGNGTNLTLLQELGHEVTGIEPDMAALRVARTKGHEVYPGTAEALPEELKGQAFDTVVFMHVMEHCIDPLRALENAKALLNENGLVVIEVPNNACTGSLWFGDSWYWLDVPRHLNFFTSSSLQELFEVAGFKVDGKFFRGYCRQFSADWREKQNHIRATFAQTAPRKIPFVTYWYYFLRTAFAPPSKKYDSVRMVGHLR